MEFLVHSRQMPDSAVSVQTMNINIQKGSSKRNSLYNAESGIADHNVQSQLDEDLKFDEEGRYNTRNSIKIVQ